MNTTGRLVIVTGPPGAGKTTVARLLVDALPYSVHLHSDDFWGFIRNGGVAPYLPEAHEQNKTVMNVLVRAAFTYAGGGYDVVLDGVIGPWFVDGFRREGSISGIPLHYAVLRPDESTTVDRAVARGEGALTDPDPIRSLHRQFTDIGEYERHVLDSTRLTPDSTAAAVLRGVGRGDLLLGPVGPADA